MAEKSELRQPRLSQREFEFRNKLIDYCWNHFKDELTMQEMSHTFRMPLAQFFKIIKTKYNQKK